MGRPNTVENPIINSPYEAPQQHWLIREGRDPEKRPGRRLASYFLRVPEKAGRGRGSKKQGALFEDASKGEEYLLDTANLLRQRVQEWRDRQYQGATNTTKELLDLWRSKDRRQPLFYAQIESAETVIFLVEGPKDLLQGIQVPMDEPGVDAKAVGYRAFLRYAVKMATGSGKTTVMGMLTAWSILNKVEDPQRAEFSDTALVLCPNVTIRDQLQKALDVKSDTSLFKTAELVPPHRIADLRRGEVIATNWHNLERRESTDVNGQSAKVVKRGQAVQSERKIKLGGKDAITEADVRHQAMLGAFEIMREEKAKSGELRAVVVRETKYYESDAAFLKRVLGQRKGRSSAILVMNDEAHHAYRRGTVEEDEDQEDEIAEMDAREATVWIEGLDRINKVLGGKGNGIRLCVDLSATPFYIQGSGNEVGRPFPWVVSDFSLIEAIEAGLVKVPQLPTDETGDGETPPYFNVWRWVQERAQREGHIGPIGPREVMRYATAPIIQLAGEWRRTEASWKKAFAEGYRGANVPPVFIIVCRDTTLARELYAWLAEGDPQYGEGVPEFLNSVGQENTVRIDSKVGEDIAAGGTKDETRRLRFILETVGKTEWPGRRSRRNTRRWSRRTIGRRSRMRKVGS